MLDKQIEFYGTGTIGEKGQIVIPAKARKKLKINSGCKFIFFGHGPVIHIAKTNEFNSILHRITEKFTKNITNLKKKIKKESKK